MTFGIDQLRLLSGMDRPMTVSDPYNDLRPPTNLPYNQRFAGGQVYRSSYTPYDGDLTRYGMGAQHRYWVPGTSGWTTDGGGTGTGTGTSTRDDGTQQQQNGGPDGGQSDASQRDSVHGKSFDEMTNEALMDYAKSRNSGGFLQRNFEMLAPSLLSSLVMGGLEKNQLAAELAGRGLSNPADFVGGAVSGGANTGMNNAGGVANPELAGRSDPSQQGGGDTNEGPAPAEGWSGGGPGAGAGVEGQGGFLAKGGPVIGDKKHGQDDVTIRADGGEFVIKAKESVRIGRDILSRLNAGHYDLARLKKAVGL